jgi:hypothetical protein
MSALPNTPTPDGPCWARRTARGVWLATSDGAEAGLCFGQRVTLIDQARLRLVQERRDRGGADEG